MAEVIGRLGVCDFTLSRRPGVAPVPGNAELDTVDVDVDESDDQAD